MSLPSTNVKCVCVCLSNTDPMMTAVSVCVSSGSFSSHSLTWCYHLVVIIIKAFFEGCYCVAAVEVALVASKCLVVSSSYRS